MTKLFLALAMLIAASLMFACGGSGGNNAAAPSNAKPANATNTAAAPADNAANEADIRKLMADGAAALGKNDADAMEKIYADNYMLVNIDGSVQNKSERLAAIKSGDVKYTSFSYSDAVVRINPEGTGAVVIAKLSMKGTTKGKSMDGDYRVTHVYAKTKDGWKQVSAQATKIEASAGKTEDKPLAPAAPSDKMPDKSAAPANK